MSHATLARIPASALERVPPDLARDLIAAAGRDRLHFFLRQIFDIVVPQEPLVDNWHLRAICYALEQVAQGEIRRLIVTLPPRSLKSIIASVAYPAWVLGRDPSRRIVCVSYSRDLAGKHSRDFRAVVRSVQYRRTFPRLQIDARKDTEFEMVTTRRGGRFSTSIDGTLTGRGGNLIVIDDPLKAQDAYSEAARARVNDWFDKTALSRLDNKRSDSIVVVTQRLHEEDLVGHLLEQGGWSHLCIPAIAPAEQTYAIGPEQTYVRQAGELLLPDREPQHVLDEMRAALGSAAFSAQYLQEPLPAEGTLIKWQWFRTYDQRPMREAGDRIAQSWDTAYSNEPPADYSVCTTWLRRGELHWLLDVRRERLLYPDLKRRAIELKRQWNADDVLIEKKGSGISLYHDLERERIRAIPIDPEGDKVVRMSTESATIEAGKVHIPDGAPWLDDFRREVLQFPNGRHDDQVDSMSQYLRWIRKQADRVVGTIRIGGMY